MAGSPSKREKTGGLTGPLVAALVAAKLHPSQFVSKFEVRRARKTDDLRGTLMPGFALLAILPLLVAVGFMTRTAEHGFGVSTDELARISQGAITETSDHIGSLARDQIDQTGDRLTNLGSRAVRDTSQAVLGSTEQGFAEANRQLILQGERSNGALASRLGTLSRESNRVLADQTARDTEQTIWTLSDRGAEPELGAGAQRADAGQHGARAGGQLQDPGQHLCPRHRHEQGRPAPPRSRVRGPPPA